jgi:hypothetical protein
MTSILKFYKDLEKYGLIKDSQFILNIPLELLREIFDDVKHLHKQEIIDAYNKSFELRDKPYSTADKYYQETFVSKGSDYKYHEQRRGINVDSFDSVAPKEEKYIVKVTEVELSQQEISDEEIEKAAKNSAIEQFEAGNSVYTLAFQEGYKWYREQLKQRQ